MILPLVASTAAMLLGLAVVYWIHTRYYLDIVVEAISDAIAGPLISICIPARNEARTIAACVEAAFSQTYPNVEVIVVDDGSTDRTAEILGALKSEFPGLRVLNGSPLPPGWAGKPHALDQAAQQALGAWLCFLDADTVLAPAALASCYTKAIATSADLFTILTRQTMESFWERVLMPIVMTALSVGFPPRRVNDPTVSDAVANGQFMLIRREAYDAVGGHTKIRNQIVDDKALAELIKRSGRRLVLADGRDLARTRMYTSLPEMWEGWTKNIYLGLRDRPATVILGALGAVILLAGAVLLPVWPIAGFIWYLRGGGASAMVIVLESILLWSAILIARGAAAHAMGIPHRYALTTPLGSGLFAAMMVTSAWKVLSGRGVTWRGRTYTDL